MRYSREYKTQHQNIIFTLRTRRIQLIEDIGKEYQKINKEPDTTNLENLPKYIQSFTYLFKKKKFKKLLE